MRYLALTLFVILHISLLAQTDITKEIQSLYDEEKYEQVIKKYGDNAETYPTEAIFLIGKSYYYASDDNMCIRMMDLVLKKDNEHADACFFKGQSNAYMEKFNEAIVWYNKAISIDDAPSHYHSALGDSYFNLERYKKALEAYTTATEKEDPEPRAFAMIPQIYAEQGDTKKALDAFYIAKDKLKNDPESYMIAIYNIGLFEYLEGNYEKAEPAFKELIDMNPKDFHSRAKLIQCYYGQEEYDMANPYKEELYKAWEQKQLPDDMKNMFCFDQFDWEDKHIQVYERFEEEEGELYYKHLFYILDERGNIEFRIQTENSPISISMGGPKYAVGMNKGASHSTFGFIEEDFDYGDLKEIVIGILEKEISAAASSTVVTKEEKGKKKKKKK